jgi:TolB-like protein/pimeloyl-ACP methyl ester carboxylesterase/tetratricopeptide (TPR) repeat protein
LAPQNIPEVRYARSGNVHIAYQVYGNGPVNLVLTPGSISHIAHYWSEPSWRRWLEGLGCFARTAIFDKRGTGLSDRDSGTPTYEQRMDDIRAVMDAASFDKAVLVGFSDGVAMSILFASRYPTRTKCLVLYGGAAKGSWAPDHPWETTNEQFVEHLERLERTYGTQEMAERWVSLAAPSRLGDVAFTSWMGELLRMGCSPGAAMALSKSGFEMDVRNTLPKIRVPTLVIHPTDDKMVDVRGGRYVAEHIPGARMLEFPSRDHWFFVGTQQTDIILREIERFATGLEPSTRVQIVRRDESRLETKRRLAVLPLVNIGANTQDEYFVDGMTEELITAVSRLPDLKVIARTSVMRYKATEKGAAEIGRELEVGSLLEGTVRKSQDGIRISVQLIDAQTEEHLWAQTYDRKLGDVFKIQSKIANQVARGLRLKLSETAPLPTRDAEAHELYLRARYHWNMRSEEGVMTAIRYFEEAIDKDPEYSPALVGLADCYSTSALFGFASPIDVFPKARELALRALKSGGASAEAHASLGEILMHYSYDWAAAARELERALQINPNYTMAHVWRSTCYAVLGQMDEALVEARRAEELNPFAVVAMHEVAKNLYYARRNDEAITRFVHSLKVEPDSAYLHMALAEAYAQESMFTEARHETERTLTLSGRSAFFLGAAAYVYALAGDDKKSREILAELDRLQTSQILPAEGRAAAYATLGDKRRALQLLDQAYTQRSRIAWVKVDPGFVSLEKEEAFHALLRKMNLESDQGSAETSGRPRPPLQVQEEFEFNSDRSKVIFDQLASDFVRDYLSLNFMEEKSGWRTIVELARETGIPLSSLYSKARGGAAPFRELWKRGLIEMRLSPGERGRGGEVTKIRIAYTKAPIRNHVEHLARVVKKPGRGSTSGG